MTNNVEEERAPASSTDGKHILQESFEWHDLFMKSRMSLDQHLRFTGTSSRLRKSSWKERATYHCRKRIDVTVDTSELSYPLLLPTGNQLAVLRFGSSRSSISTSVEVLASFA